jgi:hypothetical protein
VVRKSHFRGCAPLAPQLLGTTGTAGRNPSPPTDIQQVGYYIPANGSTWAAYWSPTDASGEVVYTADAYRGVDVLRIDNGGLTGKNVKAPVRDEWFGSPTLDSASRIPPSASPARC